MKMEKKIYTSLGKSFDYDAVTIENDGDKRTVQARIREIDTRMYAVKKNGKGELVEVMTTKQWAKARVQVFFLLKELERYIKDGSSMTTANNYESPFNMYTFDRSILDT